MKNILYILLFFSLSAAAQNKAVLRVAGGDTTNLSTRINGKLNISDTAAMLTPYLRKGDTVTLSDRINARLRIADTSAMLSPYLRRIDTASLSTRINGKLNISDTANMLVPYALKAQLLNPDSVILNRPSFQNKQFNIRVGIADTLSASRVGIGIVTPAASSILDLTSTTRGFLPPRMTTTERDAIVSPAEGLVIYNTDWKVLNTFNGTFWEEERRVVKTTNTSRVNDATATPDPDLQVALSAGVWEVKFQPIILSSPGGFRFQFTGPALSTFSTATSSGNILATQIFTKINSTTSIVGSTTNATLGAFPLSFIWECDTSGTLVLNWGQNTSNAIPAEILANSVITAKRIR